MLPKDTGQIGRKTLIYFGSSNPVPSSHTKYKAFKIGMLNYEPVNQVIDKEEMKKILTHFKLSENSIFIKRTNITTGANLRNITIITSLLGARLELRWARPTMLQVQVAGFPQSPQYRPTGNSSAKLGGKVRSGSSGKPHTDKATVNSESEARAELMPELGSHKREAGGCTRLFRYYAPQDNLLRYMLKNTETC